MPAPLSHGVLVSVNLDNGVWRVAGKDYDLPIPYAQKKRPAKAVRRAWTAHAPGLSTTRPRLGDDEPVTLVYTGQRCLRAGGSPPAGESVAGAASGQVAHLAGHNRMNREARLSQGEPGHKRRHARVLGMPPMFPLAEMTFDAISCTVRGHG